MVGEGGGVGHGAGIRRVAGGGNGGKRAVIAGGFGFGWGVREAFLRLGVLFGGVLTHRRAWGRDGSGPRRAPGVRLSRGAPNEVRLRGERSIGRSAGRGAGHHVATIIGGVGDRRGGTAETTETRAGRSRVGARETRNGNGRAGRRTSHAGEYRRGVPGAARSDHLGLTTPTGTDDGGGVPKCHTNNDGL